MAWNVVTLLMAFNADMNLVSMMFSSSRLHSHTAAWYVRTIVIFISLSEEDPYAGKCLPYIFDSKSVYLSCYERSQPTSYPIPLRYSSPGW